MYIKNVQRYQAYTAWKPLSFDISVKIMEQNYIDLVPSPFLGLACAEIVESRFLELAMSSLDFSPWIPLGTFSILHYTKGQKDISSSRIPLRSFKWDVGMKYNVLFINYVSLSKKKIRRVEIYLTYYLQWLQRKQLGMQYLGLRTKLQVQ